MAWGCDAGAQEERDQKKRREEMELASAIEDEEEVSEELWIVC